jgi:uncharacterized NAD(P)/FAD-binding protein YdhS
MDVASMRVAVIGGGFAGTALAVSLQARLPADARILLFEPAPRIGPGLAYGTTDSAHLLNVPAGSMSLYPDRPGHFSEWLAARPDAPAAPADSGPIFAPRVLFGAYLEEQLAAAMARPGAAIEVLRHRVDAVERQPGGGFRLSAVAGQWDAGRVMLAVGGFAAAPGEPPFLAGDPWDPATLAGIDPDAAVLLVGMGLTMVDMLLSLRHRGHRGKVIGLSRHGWLPLPHVTGPLPPPWPVLLPSPAQQADSGQAVSPADAYPVASLADMSLAAPPANAGQGAASANAAHAASPQNAGPAAAPQNFGPAALCRALRQAAAEAAIAGQPWQSVIDGARPHLPRVWGGLSLKQRATFLRHGRSLWNLHRHRLAPAVARFVAAAVASGGLESLAARLESWKPAPGGGVLATLRLRGGGQRVVDVARIILCTGPNGPGAWRDAAPVPALLRNGLARMDALGLGLDVAGPDGTLRGADGQPVPGLHAVGPLTRGTLWEITAVPEIRAQADLATD